MTLRLFCRCAAALTTVLVLVVSQAQAAWTITTYMATGNVLVTSMEVADQYFTGALPQRFVGESTVTHVNLWENGGLGQFGDVPPNNPQFPFPGLDNVPVAGNTNNYTARITGTLVVAADNTYHFFTDSDDGNRFRLDINQNGTFEDVTESIVPNGGLQAAGNPGDTTTAEQSTDMGFYPDGIPLTAGNYNFEISMFELSGNASIDAGYRRGTDPFALAIGDPRRGISLLGPAQVRVVGAETGPLGLSSFAAADALRAGPQRPGFPVTELRDVFNIVNGGGDGDFPGGEDAPGLAPTPPAEDVFFVVGTGFLAVPRGGISNAYFRSNTDDGGRLLIDRNQDGDLSDPEDIVLLQDRLQSPFNTTSGDPASVTGTIDQPGPVTLAEGLYSIEYSFFENGGGAEGEVSVSLTGPEGPFFLLGDNAAVAAGTSLDVIIPEPTSLALLGLAVANLVGFARRRKQMIEANVELQIAVSVR